MPGRVAPFERRCSSCLARAGRSGERRAAGALPATRPHLAMIEGYPQRALAAVRRSMPRHAWDAFADVIAKDRFRQEGHLRKPHTEVDRTLLHLLVTLRT